MFIDIIYDDQRILLLNSFYDEEKQYKTILMLYVFNNFSISGCASTKQLLFLAKLNNVRINNNY